MTRTLADYYTPPCKIGPSLTLAMTGGETMTEAHFIDYPHEKS